MKGSFNKIVGMSLLWRVCATATSLVASVAGAYATYTRVYYHVGRWDVFSGQTDNGQPFCGIGTTDPADGRSISIQFDIGGHLVDFRAAKAGWSIPAGTKLTAVMQFGAKAHWTAQAEGHGNMVRWSLDRATTQAFDDRFRHTKSMILTFPDGSEPAWTISLTGSRQADDAFGRCIADLGRSRGAEVTQARRTLTQPFRSVSKPSFAQGTSPETLSMPR